MEEVVVTGTAPTAPPLSTAIPVAGGVAGVTQPSGGLPTEPAPPMEEVVIEGTKPVEPPLEVVAPIVGGAVGVTQPSGAPDVVEPPMEEVTIETSKPTEPPLTIPPFDLVEPPDLKDILKEPDIKESPFDKLKGVIDNLSTLQKLAGLVGAFGAGKATGQKGTGVGVGAPTGGALPKYEFDRVQTRPDIDYFTYGTRPEVMFFQDTMSQAAPVTEGPVTGQAPPDEGGPFAKGGLAEGGRYYEGEGSGRDDKIPALLSDGEYVIDAETLALLGDGSPKEGARRMDQFRAKIRKHQGSALSRGRISPNAKSPDKYMGGGLRR
jgi:hypothetical protein